MADNSNFSLPWASLAVVAALVSGVWLAPHAFQQLRPPERERAQPVRAVDMEIDARLWEDPFVAARRFEAERVESCGKLALAVRNSVPECNEEQVRARRDPPCLLTNLDKDQDGDREDTLIILALVPGNPFVGAEESRRRTRYALLAGLQAKGYVPDAADHIGLLQFRLPSQLDVSIHHELIVPYELLSQRRLLRGDAASEPRRDQPRPKHYAQIALIWVDEAALPAPKLDGLARLLQALLGNEPSRPHLALIGPSSSDALRIALADLKRASGYCQSNPTCSPLDDQVLAGYRLLAQAEILNYAATAPQRLLEELDSKKLENFLDERFGLLDAGKQRITVDFRRTIATDVDVVRSLVNELSQRLAFGAKRRVVLVAERDSLYAQALVSEIRYRMSDFPRLRFEVVYFFRGLDGVTTREGGKESGATKAEGVTEWPEARDQLDYLRRMAIGLKDSESTPGQIPIGAIGILANDVHDKLLVLQALHGTFQDKVFFTTDMDARYLHPRTLEFTRNLVVASSLPLAFPDPALQAGVPPLRDVYQSAAFLAARIAACRSSECKDLESVAMQKAIRSPSVYEIGRSHAVPVSGYDFSARPPASQHGRAVVAISMIALLVTGLFLWPSTPALRQLHDRLWPRTDRQAVMPAIGWSTMAFAAAYGALLAYWIGSVTEFVHPGRTSVASIIVAAAACAIFVVLLCLCIGAAGVRVPLGPRTGAMLAVCAAALCGVTLGLVWPARHAALCYDCEPVAWLEGVSAWPSHLIHLIALAAVLWWLDQLWSDARTARDEDGRWLNLSEPPERPPVRRSRYIALRIWLARHSLLSWRRHPGCVDFRSLWRQYLERGHGRARLVRIAAEYIAAAVAVGVLFHALSEGYVPEVPVRGAEHRRLVAWTLYALLLLLPLLVVAVADSTMLTCSFIWHLNGRQRAAANPLDAGHLPGGTRTLYPASTVERFARNLGREHLAMWMEPIAAEPHERGLNDPAQLPAHSLLDDWIDVQLVARCTRQVAPLILGPFVVLALIVVARSRLFDGWSLTLPMALAALFYLAWLVVLACLLKIAVEQTRGQALVRMNRDLQWLAGTHMEVLVKPFERLIAAVQAEQRGAFAPLMEQPLFRALLVPLGGAGGAQLVDLVLLAR